MADDFVSILESIKIPEACTTYQLHNIYLEKVKSAWKEYADKLNAERVFELQKEVNMLRHQIYMIRTMEQIALPYSGYQPIGGQPPQSPTTGSNAIKPWNTE